MVLTIPLSYLGDDHTCRIYLSFFERQHHVTYSIYLHEFKNELAMIGLALSILREEPGRLNDSIAYYLWGE